MAIAPPSATSRRRDNAAAMGLWSNCPASSSTMIAVNGAARKAALRAAAYASGAIDRPSTAPVVSGVSCGSSNERRLA